MLVNSRYWIFRNAWFVAGYAYNKFFFHSSVILVEWTKHQGITIPFNCPGELKPTDAFSY